MSLLDGYLVWRVLALGSNAAVEMGRMAVAFVNGYGARCISCRRARLAQRAPTQSAPSAQSLEQETASPRHEK